MDKKQSITIEEAFQRSVNIRYDYGDDAKVKDYIASSDSLELLGKLIWSTANNAANRSNILIGAYGRGKSHLILVLLTLICAENRESCANIIAQIKQHDAELYTYVADYIANNRKLLPVIISGNSDSISQSFLRGLQEALDRAQLTDIMPDTHFDTALKMIQNWKANYPQTYVAFIQLMGESADIVEDKLKAYDADCYKKFLDVYPTITSGSTFNPFADADVVELYTDVAGKLSNFNYEGLYVVYDEFSKYLEANIKTATISDIKLLQDFAEKADRSGNAQMHLLLITHKDIHNYIDILPKEKTDGWRGIAERFVHHEMQGDIDQTYELIGKVIHKNESFYNETKVNYATEFNAVYADVQRQQLFTYQDETAIKMIVDGCYPLHPVTAFLLPRLSEKVAQNERTLFTFLASDQKYTLKEFLQKQDKDYFWMTPDYLYDYFEPQFKKESYQSEIRKIYMTTTSALKRVEKGSIHEKLLKTLAIVAICNEMDVLPANDVTLSFAYRHIGYSGIAIAEALTELLKANMLYREANSGFLVLKDGSQSNMEQVITDAAERIKLQYAVEDILNAAIVDKYLYPTRYNENYAITRYFQFEFISETALMEPISLCDPLSEVVYGIVLHDASMTDAIRKYLTQSQWCCRNQVCVLPKEYFEISTYAYRYQAIRELLESGTYQGAAKEELLFQQEDLEMVFKNFFALYTMPEHLQSEYYCKGEVQNVYRKSQLTNLLSTICEQTYDKTPIINNEMINKDNVEKAIIGARNKVVDGLLETHLQPMLGLIGNGPDVSMTRAILKNYGILEETEEDGIVVRTHDLADDNVQYVFNTIFAFLKEAQQRKVSFAVLYEKLTLPEYHIGLKKGVIPVFLAVVLHDLKSQVLIEKQDKEVELSSELLLNINENPQAYTIMLEEWDEEKQKYIIALEACFAKYIVEKEKQFNGFTYVYKAMQRWFLNLPKVTKNLTIYYDVEQGQFNEYADDKKQLIQLLRNLNLGAQRFLFTDVPALYETCNGLSCVADKFAVLKAELDNNYAMLVEGLSNALKQEFSMKTDVQEVSLQSIWNDWYEQNKNRVANAEFTSQQERIAGILNQEKTEQSIVQDLAKDVIGLRLVDWKLNHFNMFLEIIANFKTEVEQASDEEPIIKQEELLEQVDDITTLSRNARYLLNDLKNLFDEEYRESVSNKEKKAVIAEILKML